MKKITKKLSMKYVKLHKCRAKQDGSMKLEEDGGELFRETNSPGNYEESNETKEAPTKETPKVTKIMESMHRKLKLKEKAHKKNVQVDMDGHDEPQMSERSVRNGGRDRKDHQLEDSVRNKYRDGMDHVEGSVRNGHMDHLEDLIKGRTNQLEGSSKTGQRENVTPKTEGSSKNGQRETVTPKTEGSNRNSSDFASKKDYLDWIEYVEGSSNHCFDRFETTNSGKPYRKEDHIEHDVISVGISEGSIEGSNDEIQLLKSSKYRKNEDSKGYKKGKGQ